MKEDRTGPNVDAAIHAATDATKIAFNLEDDIATIIGAISSNLATGGQAAASVYNLDRSHIALAHLMVALFTCAEVAISAKDPSDFVAKCSGLFSKHVSAITVAGLQDGNYRRPS